MRGWNGGGEKGIRRRKREEREKKEMFRELGGKGKMLEKVTRGVVSRMDMGLVKGRR
jgi:hypothetical protein